MAASVEATAIDRRMLAIAGAASAAVFLVYARRLCPTLSLLGDSGELVAAAATWGIPHAPGYPLFTVLAHAFTWLPFGELAWRVHLTSALFHAGAVGATVLATFEITRSHLGALAAGAALALERSFFFGSLYAEVFPLNDLFFATLLFLALRLRAHPGAVVPFAIATSLASAHHMMIALAFPSLAILVARPLRAMRPKLAILLVALLLPGTLVYALIPLQAWRAPAVSWGGVHDLSSLVALVTRHDYGGLLSSVHGGGHGTGGERLRALADLVGRGFGPWTLLVAAVGALSLLRSDTTVGIALLMAVAMTGPLFAWLNALGTSTEEALAFFERFTTMCAVPIAITFGAGVSAAAKLASSPASRVLGALALAGCLVLSALRVSGVDLRDDRRGLAFAHDLILHTPDRSLLLLSGDAAGNAALYVCVVEHLCGDRVPLSPGSLFLPWAMADVRSHHPDLVIPWTSGPGLKRTHELAAANASSRPVFVYPDLLAKDPRVADVLVPVPDRLLFRLWPTDAALAPRQGQLLASARAIVGRAASARDACEGCDLPAPLDHPTQDMELVHAYEAAAFNHANALEALPGVSELVTLLFARSGNYAQGGGASMSRNVSSSSR